MELREVTYDQLSNLKHQVLISDKAPGGGHDFLVVQFQGVYKPGGAGRGDALYIVSAVEAAQKAWWALCTVIDFRELDYVWGNEMDWVAAIGWDPVTQIQAPIAIVVSDKCRKAMKSLLPDKFERICFDTMERAFENCQARAIEWRKQMKEWRPNHPVP